jgi:hypothetical protein
MSRHNCHPEPRFRAKDLPEYLGLDPFRWAFKPGFVEKPSEDFHDRNIAAGPSPKTAQDDRFFFSKLSELPILQSRAYITNLRQLSK